MAAQELGSGMNHNVRAVLNGANQIGGAEGVVHHQGQAVLVGQRRQSVNVWNVGVGVAQSLNVDGTGVGPDGLLHLVQVVDVHEGSGDAEAGQGMLQQVVAAAVDGLLRHEVAAVLTQGLKHIVDGGGTGCHGQRGYAALQSRDPLLQHVLGGVGQAAIDVAGIGQAETGSGVLAIAEHIGSGSVNGNGAGIGSGIGLLLANMELQSFKFIVRHRIISFLSSVVFGCRLKDGNVLHIRPKRKFARISVSIFSVIGNTSFSITHLFGRCLQYNTHILLCQ